MFKLFLKIFKTPNNIIFSQNKDLDQADTAAAGKKIENKVKKLFRGSLAIRQIDAGSDNACEQELLALSNSFYDIERFGIHFVASPRHADMLLVTGPVTRNRQKQLNAPMKQRLNQKLSWQWEMMLLMEGFLKILMLF